jgi:hypothetical protein
MAGSPLFVIPAKAGIQLSASCEARNPLMSCAAHAIFDWIPAFAHCCPARILRCFAGMTAIELLALFELRHRQTTLSACDPSCRHGFAKRMPDSSERKLESSDLKICKGTGFQLSLE